MKTGLLFVVLIVILAGCFLAGCATRIGGVGPGSLGKQPAYERGWADAERQLQRERERRLYECGRSGKWICL